MRLLNILAVSTLLVGCASMATSGFDKSNTMGRDVDEVIKEIREKGLSCEKYKDKEFPTNRVIGGVICTIKEKSLVCPTSYRISLSFELSTNKVSGFLKDERDNCF